MYQTNFATQLEADVLRSVFKVAPAFWRICLEDLFEIVCSIMEPRSDMLISYLSKTHGELMLMSKGQSDI
jgi:hypothetical protein